jgi:glutathione S-transferase
MFETLLVETGGAAYFCGAQPLYCDYLIWEMIDLSLRLDAASTALYPQLQRFYETMKARPAIAAYLASGRRPERVNNSRYG